MAQEPTLYLSNGRYVLDNSLQFSSKVTDSKLYKATFECLTTKFAKGRAEVLFKSKTQVLAEAYTPIFFAFGMGWLKYTLLVSVSSGKVNCTWTNVIYWEPGKTGKPLEGPDLFFPQLLFRLTEKELNRISGDIFQCINYLLR